MELGNSNRKTTSTLMNSESSRSHLVFTVFVHSNDKILKEKKDGKLFLVDLAGSEKVNKTGAHG